MTKTDALLRRGKKEGTGKGKTRLKEKRGCEEVSLNIHLRREDDAPLTLTPMQNLAEGI